MEVLANDHGRLFTMVDPRQRRQKSLEICLPRRGRQPLPPLVLRSRFPVNFFIRSQEVSSEQEITVFPAPLPCSDVQQPDPGGGHGTRQNWQKGYEGDINRISNYRGGEPLKAIHWKLSARHDRLKVKELSSATRKPVVLDLAALPGTGLEQRLGFATFLVSRWLRGGWPVGLKAGALELPPGLGRRHKLLLLKTLAHYGSDQTTA